MKSDKRFVQQQLSQLRVPLPAASPSSDFDDFLAFRYKGLFSSDKETEDEGEGPLFSCQCRSHSHPTLRRRSGGGGRSGSGGSGGGWRGREEARRRRRRGRGEGRHGGGEAVERPVRRFQGINVGDDNGETDIRRRRARNSETNLMASAAAGLPGRIVKAYMDFPVQQLAVAGAPASATTESMASLQREPGGGSEAHPP